MATDPGSDSQSAGRRTRRSIRRVLNRVPVPLPARWRQRFWTGARRVLQLDDAPESLALGIALGLFIAFTPTVGIQMLLVLVIHTICRANRLAGIAMVWISNPITLVPIYWGDYQVGRVILGREPIAYQEFARLFQFESKGFIEQFQEFLRHLGPVFADVAIPLFTGGAIVGLLLALPSYPLTLWLVRHERAGQERLRALKALRRSRASQRILEV